MKIKKGQILYARYGYGKKKFFIVATDGKKWVAKCFGLDIYIDSSEEKHRGFIFTDDFVKWYQFWK